MNSAPTPPMMVIHGTSPAAARIGVRFIGWFFLWVA
jgi:hypothetical protein